MKEIWQTLDRPLQLFAIFMASFAIVLTLILLAAYAHSQFEAATLSTLWAAIIAGAAAIGASQLTGQQFQKAERIKYEREVSALKLGIVHELCWAADKIYGHAKISKRYGEPLALRSQLNAAVLPHGLKIYDRAAAKLPMTGDKFTSSAVACYGILHSGSVLNTNGNSFVAFAQVQISELMDHLWQLSKHDELSEDSKKLLLRTLFNITQDWFTDILRSNDTLESSPLAQEAFLELIKTVKKIEPNVLEAAEHMVAFSKVE